MKTLLLMRHAKSDWAAPQGDHERPLNHRGVRSAGLIGRLMADRGETPDHVISSTAVRARTTADLAAEAGGWTAAIVLDRDLYVSGPDGVLAVATRAPDVDRLMLVGHQPIWSLIVHELTGVRVDLKTAAVAVIDIDAAGWSDLTNATGALSEVVNPGDYFGSDHDS